VLYEMLAGHRAFEGTTPLVVLAAIASSEPAPIARIADAHPHLEHVLRRCLKKDPSSAGRASATSPASSSGSPGDWTGARGGARTGVGTGAIPPVVAPRAAGRSRPRRRGRHRHVGTRERPGARRAAGDDVHDRDAAHRRFVGRRVPRRDEHRVRRRLRRQPDAVGPPLGQMDSRMLPGTTGATQPFWSPDGRTVAFFAEDKLKRIDLGATARW
jgi:hypothetical protein